MDAGLTPAQAADALGLPMPGSGPYTPNLIRRHYLRRAVRVHPDKCRDPGAVQEFQRLKAAHDLLLSRAVGDAHSAAEAAASADLLSTFLRAMTGELRDASLEAELASLGVYRPPEAFGVDLAIRFQGADGGRGPEESADAKAALRDVFAQQGVPWEEEEGGAKAGTGGDGREASNEDAAW